MPNPNRPLAPGDQVVVVHTTHPQATPLVGHVGTISGPTEGLIALMLSKEWIVDMPSAVGLPCENCGNHLSHRTDRLFNSCELRRIEDPDLDETNIVTTGEELYA